MYLSPWKYFRNQILLDYLGRWRNQSCLIFFQSVHSGVSGKGSNFAIFSANRRWPLQLLYYRTTVIIKFHWNFRIRFHFASVISIMFLILFWVIMLFAVNFSHLLTSLESSTWKWFEPGMVFIWKGWMQQLHWYCKFSLWKFLQEQGQLQELTIHSHQK